MLYFRRHFSDALQAQLAWIDVLKKQSTSLPAGVHSVQPSERVVQEAGFVEAPSVHRPPKDVAWELLCGNTASEDQIDFLSLVTMPIQKAWEAGMQKPSSHPLAT